MKKNSLRANLKPFFFFKFKQHIFIKASLLSFSYLPLIWTILLSNQNLIFLTMATAHLRLSQRMPLHPLNNNNTTTVTATDSVLVSIPKQLYRILHSDERNLLNHQHPVTATATATEKMETTVLDLNSSLAEELNAARMKTERLRLDKEKTEKMLKEREALLLLQMKEIEERGQIQRHLEIQVDRLFRLKELKSYSTVIN